MSSHDRNEELNEQMSDFLAKMEFEAKHQNEDEITKGQPVPAPSTINECDGSDLYQVVYDITQYFGNLGKSVPKTQMNLKMPPHVQLVKVYADHGVPGQGDMSEEDYCFQENDPIKLLPIQKTAVLTKLFKASTDHPTMFEELQGHLNAVEVALKPSMDFFNQVAIAMRTTNVIDPNGFSLPTVPSVTMPPSVFKLKQSFDPNGLVSIDDVPTSDAVSQMAMAFQSHIGQLKLSGLSDKFTETVGVFLNANPESLALRLEAMTENGSSKLAQMLTEAINNVREMMGHAYAVTIMQRKMHELLESMDNYSGMVVKLRTEIQGKPYPVALVDGNNGFWSNYGSHIIVAVIIAVTSWIVSFLMRLIVAVALNRSTKKKGGSIFKLEFGVNTKLKGKGGKEVIHPPTFGHIDYLSKRSREEVDKLMKDYQQKAKENLALFLKNNKVMMSMPIENLADYHVGGVDNMPTTITQLKFHNQINECLRKNLAVSYEDHELNLDSYFDAILTPGRSVFHQMIDYQLSYAPIGKFDDRVFQMCYFVCSEHFNLPNKRQSYDDAANAMAEVTSYAISLSSWILEQVKVVKELLELGPQDDSKYLAIATRRPSFQSALYAKVLKLTGEMLKKQEQFFEDVESKKPMQNSASHLTGKLNLSFSPDANDYPMAAHVTATKYMPSTPSNLDTSQVRNYLVEAKKKHHFNMTDLFNIAETASGIVDANKGSQTVEKHLVLLQDNAKKLLKNKSDIEADASEVDKKYGKSDVPDEKKFFDLICAINQSVSHSTIVIQEIIRLTGQYLMSDKRMSQRLVLFRDITKAELTIAGTLAEYADAIRDGG